MSHDVIGWIVGAALTLLGAAVAARSSRKAAQASASVESIRADTESSVAAQQIYAGIVDDLREEIDRLQKDGRAEIGRLQKDLSELRRLYESSTSENDEMRRRIASLQRTVDRLTRLLESHNIPLPMEAQ